ncbi:MAG TPA: DUF4292 domain-containing protein [Terriglobia bacterium]|nr:DUF4292 domain-containing protein [Terriglobia bacterium]
MRLKAWSLAALLALLPSCIFHNPFPHTTRVDPPLPAVALSPAELLEKLDETSEAVETLRASGDFHVSGGALKTFESTEAQASGILVVERPDKIHVQVKLLGVTVADMVSLGSEYRMRLPSKKQFFTGDAANRATTSEKWYENMRPGHIQDALFVNTLPYRTDPHVKYTIEQDKQGRRSFYVIDFLEETTSGALEKRQRIWFDRYDKEVTRKKIFRSDGVIEADVEYMEYQTFCGVAFPRTIVMRRPLDDYELTITLAPDKIRLNEQMNDDMFGLSPQPGDKVILRDARENSVTP